MRLAKPLLVSCVATALVATGSPSAFAGGATPAPGHAAKKAATAALGQVPASGASEPARVLRSDAEDPLATLRRAAAAGPTVALVAQTASGTSVSDIAAQARSAGGTVRRNLTKLGAVSLAVPSAKAVALAQELLAQPGVTSVTPAVRMQTFGTPNDTYFGSRQSSYLTTVAAPSAWDTQAGSSGVTIAVIDTGVDVTHPDLSSKIVGTYNAVDGGSDVTDATGHGTFVAGVAAATTNNNLGVSGAGNASSILAVKVEDANGDIYSDYAAAGITWAADHGAKVINMSFGSDQPDTLTRNAVAYAQSLGVVVVAAAGNDGAGANAVNYPAGYPSVIAVGATDAAGHRASFSEHGSWVTVAAPGVGIFSTTPSAGSTFFSAGYYNTSQGTSFASPLVAGEVGLLAAQSPTASASALRSAVLASAHGYAGLGLGTGQVDFATALGDLAPNTTPTLVAPTSDAAVTGAVPLSAQSTAAKVRFRVDGAWTGAPVTVVAGVGRTTWQSFGASNALHEVQVVDCSAAGECGTTFAAVNVTVTNTAPVITSPHVSQVVSGGFRLTASSPGGGVVFRIDGVARGFAAHAPYTFTFSGSGLADGRHTATAVECDAAKTLCQGPTSAAIAFTSKSLHPAFRSVSPSTFSPNADGRNEASTSTFGLAEPENVVVHVRNSAGGEVRTVNLGRQGAGNHRWTWNGRGNGGGRTQDGAYTINIETTRTVSGLLLHGQVSHAVNVDTTAPAMSSISGNGASVFPYVDGYSDSFAPAVTLGESASLTLTIRSTKGVVIRVLKASKPAGRAAISWNGRNASNAMLYPGAYRWTFSAMDAVGNSRSTSLYAVNVSTKRLVTKTATLTANGDSFYNAGGDPAECTEASTSLSYFAHGVWLANACSPSSYGAAISAAFYRFTLPAAMRYQSISISTAGFTIYPTSEVKGALLNTSGSGYDLTSGARVTSVDPAWYNLGGLSGASHVSSSRVATAAVFVDNAYGAPSDFDVSAVRLNVSYQVLA
jgi:subtilisin family serine protease/flagellar hook assembly protein FlgD